MFVACELKGSEDYAHSRTPFLLFTVGLLNTFTNYGHHTYHLPQSALIHWISFIVSMLELVILAKLFMDLGALLRNRRSRSRHGVVAGFMQSASFWTFAMLTLSIGIAVPPLNALIHGTHVVSAHVMGSMVGIDSMILWAAMAYLIACLVGREHPVLQAPSVRKAVLAINGFLFLFILAYFLRGASAGWSRYAGPAAPDHSVFVAAFPLVMMVSGLGLMVSVLWVLTRWLATLVRYRGQGG